MWIHKVSFLLTTFILALALTPLSHAQNSPQDYLDAHNAARAQVGVGPMTWDNNLEAYAQNYANERISDCALIHSRGPYGENIAEGWGYDFTGIDAINLWVSEKAYYDYDTNSCASGHECGHYTQVVWANSVNLGCARTQCDNGGWFVICSYNPPGNIIGEHPY